MEHIGQRADFLEALLRQFEGLDEDAAGGFSRIAQPSCRRVAFNVMARRFWAVVS